MLDRFIYQQDCRIAFRRSVRCSIWIDSQRGSKCARLFSRKRLVHLGFHDLLQYSPNQRPWRIMLLRHPRFSIHLLSGHLSFFLSGPRGTVKA
jgi:hypothetical protein